MVKVRKEIISSLKMKIGMYLTKMNTSQVFFLHRAEIHDEWGFERIMSHKLKIWRR